MARALRPGGSNEIADRIDVVEINEAYSFQALVCIRELGLNPAIISLNSGGLAIGHALAAQCIGGGQGVATVLEAV